MGVMRGRLAFACFGIAVATTDAGAESIVRTIPAAAGEAVAVNNSSLIAYVANASADRVAVVDQAGATAFIPVGRNPRYIAVDRPNATVYVSNAGDSSLSVIREGTLTATTFPVNGSGPIAVDSAANKAYILRNGNNGEVTVFDRNALTWNAINTGSHTPFDLALDPARRRLYVSHDLSGDVRAIDMTSTSDHPPTVSIQIAGRPGPIAYNPVTNKAYVLSNDARGPVVAIDGSTYATQPIAVPGHMGGPRAVAVNTRTNTIYAGFADEVAIVDGVTHNITFIPTAEVRSIYADNEGGKTYVLDAARNLTVIDGFTNRFVTVPIGSDSRAVAYIYKTQVAWVAGSTLTAVASPAPPDSGTPNINTQGLWWATNGSESGWGINLAHQGRGAWLVMSDGVQSGRNSYQGTLHRTTGPGFSSAIFDPARVTRTPVGTLAIDIANPHNGIITATVDGVTIGKSISRIQFAAPLPSCEQDNAAGAAPNYQDLWWNSPAGTESGWGLNIAHQGDALFITWFTYDADGRGMWLVGSDIRRTNGSTFSGTLYRTTGPPIAAQPWDPARVARTPVGTATIAFSDSSHGVFAYSVDGRSGSKAITRLAFAAPQTVCRQG
jgi:DNA-binding beta-propeller fold protein YncE